MGWDSKYIVLALKEYEMGGSNQKLFGVSSCEEIIDDILEWEEEGKCLPQLMIIRK